MMFACSFCFFFGLQLPSAGTARQLVQDKLKDINYNVVFVSALCAGKSTEIFRDQYARMHQDQA